MRNDAFWKSNIHLLIFFGLFIIAVLVFVITRTWQPSEKFLFVGSYPEVKELEGRQLNFQELSVYFTALAEKKGAAYAYEVLKAISVPPNIDMHLLGHVVGDVLYRQKGMEGISICREDFRNACSHSIVVGAFIERGEDAIYSIQKACYRAPGGKGAYTMCFHGLGHGVLAYAEYDFLKAVELCKKTGTSEYQNREYAECVGGAVMELIGGGFHDKELWSEMRPQYLKSDDPLSLCSVAMIPDREARELCYVYITPYLFEAVGANMGNPTGDDFKKAFPYCDSIPLQETIFRDACYRGFGKEFVGLVLGRDIRAGSVENMNDTQLSQMYDWCLLADNREGSAACMLHAMDSLFWGGENNPKVSLRFCAMMQDDYYQQSCMQHLLHAARYYFEDDKQKEEFCKQVPEEYRGACSAN
ncbi:MAG: Uncharacterized protein G01um101429_860 [Parcubacteria group bacterium Gr01-1014_29]|nr:MAG: Uncharacterized protein G01um101429_860 [Parcubacteria group bacterium Gr01-1014_29]